MFDNFLKLIPAQISTAWLAPVFAIAFACWKFFREQKRLEETVGIENKSGQAGSGAGAAETF
ncbi:MAG: hypothetical protein IPP36_13400 [Nitrosomonadales bacterium]|nr:hypothetical protein [Nitrosomonadales bacterium]